MIRKPLCVLGILLSGSPSVGIQASGGIVTPEQFSGEAPDRSIFVLRGLGFAVEMKGVPVAEPAETKDWTAEEASLIVVDYFVFRASVRRHEWH